MQASTPSLALLLPCVLALAASTATAAGPLQVRAEQTVRIQRGVVQVQAPFLAVSGGRAPYTFSLSPEVLPAGVVLGAAGTLTGITCSAEGNYPLGTVTVTDAAGASVTDASSSLLVEAAADGGCALAFDAALPAPVVGRPQRVELAAEGGTAPYTFAVASGALPAGMALSSQGVLSGTPIAGGRQQITIVVRDASGSTGARTATVEVTAVTVAPAGLAGGTVGAAYGQTLSATGGSAPYRFKVRAGSLPAGLTLSPAGKITGTPVAPGKARFTIKATDAAGAFATRSYVLVVDAAARPAWHARGVAAALVPLAAMTTRTSPIGSTWSQAATPAWREGRPVATAARRDDGGAAAAPALSDVQPRQLMLPQPGVMFSAVFAVAGGTPPYRFDIVDGSLPAGLVLEPGGQLWGRAQRTGIGEVLLRVADRHGDTLTVPLQVSVGARPDPAIDATVAGLQIAEVEALKRLSDAQVRNVWTRLDGDVDCRPGWQQSLHLNADWVDARPYGAPEVATAAARDKPVCGFSPSLWAGGTLDYGRLASSEAGTGYGFSTPGLSAGVDLMPLAGLRGGIALGLGQDSSDLGMGNRVDSRSDSLTAYGSWKAPLGVRLQAALGQARTALDVSRVPGADALPLQGQRRVSQRYAAIAGSTRVDLGGAWLLTPGLGAQAMRASVDGYAEADGSLALGYDPLQVAARDLRGSLALRREWRTAMWTVAPEFSVDWHRRLQGSASQSLRYLDDPAGTAYLLPLAASADEFALLGLAVSLRHPQGWAVRLEARGLVDSGELRGSGCSAAMVWPL